MSDSNDDHRQLPDLPHVIDDLPILKTCSGADEDRLKRLTQAFHQGVVRIAQQTKERADLVLTAMLNAFTIAVVKNAREVAFEQVQQFTHTCLDDALVNAWAMFHPPAEPVPVTMFCWCDACKYTAKILPEDEHYWQQPGPKYCEDACGRAGVQSLLQCGGVPPEDHQLTGPLPTWTPTE